MRDQLVGEAASRAQELSLWNCVSEQFEDLPLRSLPEPPPIFFDEVDAAEATGAAQCAISFDDELAFFIACVKADLKVCEIALSEYEALIISISGKASYTGSMRYLVAEKSGLSFNLHSLSDTIEYAAFFRDADWHNPFCEGLLSQVGEAPHQVYLAEETYNRARRNCG